MQAYNNYIIIEQEPETTRKTSGGLELAANHVTDIKYVKGKVISAGTRVQGVADGDEVLYRKMAGHGVEFDGVLHTVIVESDVMMIL